MSHWVTPPGFLAPGTGVVPVPAGHPGPPFNGALYAAAGVIILALSFAVGMRGRAFWRALRSSRAARLPRSSRAGPELRAATGTTP